MSDERVVWENELAYAIRDSFPVTPLHTLVIPKRHVRGYFELDHAELEACHRLLEREKAAIEREDRAVDGFNVGINDGRVAGQTVFHCHIHLIARREHDVEDPRGGRAKRHLRQGGVPLIVRCAATSRKCTLKPDAWRM
jgi:diadenosine tetraphosphate (Ap4A) HIT family hydrolase